MCRVVLGVERDKDLIEVLAPALGAPFDNLNVIGRKNCYEYRSEQLVGAPQRLAVQLHLVPARDVHFSFN
jgi:hypothetical protein